MFNTSNMDTWKDKIYTVITPLLALLDDKTKRLKILAGVTNSLESTTISSYINKLKIKREGGY